MRAVKHRSRSLSETLRRLAIFSADLFANLASLPAS
jgi:hypothetical protein